MEPRVESADFLKVDSTNFSAGGLLSVSQNSMDENKIPFANILAVASDTASVMVGINKSFATLVKEKNPITLIVPCVNHKLALAAKESCKQLPAEIWKNVADIIRYFTKSTQRYEILWQMSVSFEEKFLKLLDFSEPRWLI